MDSWLQVLSLFLANAGMVLWMRAESRSDWRHMDSNLSAIREEIKDFHGKLIALEGKKQDKRFKD